MMVSRILIEIDLEIDQLDRCKVCPGTAIPGSKMAFAERRIAHDIFCRTTSKGRSVRRATSKETLPMRICLSQPFP